jgi:hypothetical protein
VPTPPALERPLGTPARRDIRLSRAETWILEAWKGGEDEKINRWEFADEIDARSAFVPRAVSRPADPVTLLARCRSDRFGFEDARPVCRRTGP